MSAEASPTPIAQVVHFAVKGAVAPFSQAFALFHLHLSGADQWLSATSPCGCFSFCPFPWAIVTHLAFTRLSCGHFLCILVLRECVYLLIFNEWIIS